MHFCQDLSLKILLLKILVLQGMPLKKLLQYHFKHHVSVNTTKFFQCDSKASDLLSKVIPSYVYKLASNKIVKYFMCL